MAADLEDLHDVLMLEPGDGLAFRAKAGETDGVGVGTGQEHLESDDPVQVLVASLVDNAHAASAQDAEDLVAGDLRPGWIDEFGLGEWRIRNGIGGGGVAVAEAQPVVVGEEVDSPSRSRSDGHDAVSGLGAIDTRSADRTVAGWMG